MAFGRSSERPCMSGASACASGANWPSGPIATCMMSACPGATSFTKPKSRFGGLKQQGARPAKVESGFASGRAPNIKCAWILSPNRSHFGGSCAPAPPLEGDAGHRLSGKRWEPAMTALRLNDLRQYSDVLRLRSGKSLKVRFVEPGDAGALQAYIRSLTTRSRYNRFLGAISELPRSPLRLPRRYRQFRVRAVDRRPLAGPGHRCGLAEESGMPRRRVRLKTPVRRYPALQ
jgi:hypothetical protein